jgi:hypothetical protein
MRTGRVDELIAPLRWGRYEIFISPQSDSNFGIS